MMSWRELERCNDGSPAVCPGATSSDPTPEKGRHNSTGLGI